MTCVEVLLSPFPLCIFQLDTSTSACKCCHTHYFLGLSMNCKFLQICPQTKARTILVSGDCEPPSLHHDQPCSHKGNNINCPLYSPWKTRLQFLLIVSGYFFTCIQVFLTFNKYLSSSATQSTNNILLKLTFSDWTRNEKIFAQGHIVNPFMNSISDILRTEYSQVLFQIGFTVVESENTSVKITTIIYGYNSH